MQSCYISLPLTIAIRGAIIVHHRATATEILKWYITVCKILFTISCPFNVIF
jgi:hypothetical protein